ncbi:hypothetical protein COCNU_06G001530 [Cocos nucifera]|uniref:Uncharacterized protein n=1 Tax=Cocos nucifera TaxID=13894 RepID=A0A8K0I9R0_COCNU|nr:hypothetical protein COCNU_06G001530 [Cocos nucifera]
MNPTRRRGIKHTIFQLSNQLGMTAELYTTKQTIMTKVHTNLGIYILHKAIFEFPSFHHRLHSTLIDLSAVINKVKIRKL